MLEHYLTPPSAYMQATIHLKLQQLGLMNIDLYAQTQNDVAGLYKL